MTESLLLDRRPEGGQVPGGLPDRLPEEEREGGIDDVIGSQAQVDVLGVVADGLADRLEEGDDVMFDHPFDLFDSGDGKCRFLLDPLEGLRRYAAEFGPGLADGQLDVEPFAVFVFVRPDGPHFGAGVAVDHPGFLGKRSNHNKEMEPCQFDLFIS